MHPSGDVRGLIALETVDGNKNQPKYIHLPIRIVATTWHTHLVQIHTDSSIQGKLGTKLPVKLL